MDKWDIDKIFITGVMAVVIILSISIAIGDLRKSDLEILNKENQILTEENKELKIEVDTLRDQYSKMFEAFVKLEQKLD